MIEADIIQSTVRIWPPTQSFKFSKRHLFAEKASPTAAPYKGDSPGKVGSWQVQDPHGGLGVGLPREGQHPLSLPPPVPRAVLLKPQGREGGACISCSWIWNFAVCVS